MITRSSAGRTAASRASTSSGRSRRRLSHGPVPPARRAVIASCGAGAARPIDVEIGDVVASAELGLEHECSTPATRSCASSSGGRNNVLSGTSTAPMRTTADRDDRPVDAVRHQQTDARALPDAARARIRPPAPRVRRVELAEGDPLVLGDDELGGRGCSAAQRRTSAGTVRPVSGHGSSRRAARMSGLPLESIGNSSGASRTNSRAAPCTPRAWS